MLNVASTSEHVDVRKALGISMSLPMTRSYADLKLLISRWSMETHTSLAVWGEFHPNTKDVAMMFRLLLFGVHVIFLTMRKRRHYSS